MFSLTIFGTISFNKTFKKKKNSNLGMLVSMWLAHTHTHSCYDTLSKKVRQNNFNKCHFPCEMRQAIQKVPWVAICLQVA